MILLYQSTLLFPFQSIPGGEGGGTFLLPSPQRVGLLLLSSFRQTEGTPRSSRLLSPQARGKDFAYLFTSRIKKPSPRLSGAVLPCGRKHHCNFVILRAIYLATIVFLYFLSGEGTWGILRSFFCCAGLSEVPSASVSQRFWGMPLRCDKVL